ncbi:MAG: chloramphenicol phosphotransferase CPT family protein [Candidatus Babeliales bacterium]
MKKYSISIALSICALTTLLVLCNKLEQPKPIIILLNGASASGKSSIQKELQKLFSTPYLGMGLDSFFVGVLPLRFVTGPQLPHDISHELVMKGEVGKDDQGNRLFTLLVGPEGDKVMHGMHYAIAAYAQQGSNCIVDYIAYKRSWISNLYAAWHSAATVYLIGVDCPIEILEEREKARGRSFVEGHARSHYITVHDHFDNNYDLRVDTSKLTAEQCAHKIYNFITHERAPKAFAELANHLK